MFQLAISCCPVLRSCGCKLWLRETAATRQAKFGGSQQKSEALLNRAFAAAQDQCHGIQFAPGVSADSPAFVEDHPSVPLAALSVNGRRV